THVPSSRHDVHSVVTIEPVQNLLMETDVLDPEHHARPDAGGAGPRGQRAGIPLHPFGGPTHLVSLLAFAVRACPIRHTPAAIAPRRGALPVGNVVSAEEARRGEEREGV